MKHKGIVHFTHKTQLDLIQCDCGLHMAFEHDAFVDTIFDEVVCPACEATFSVASVVSQKAEHETNDFDKLKRAALGVWYAKGCDCCQDSEAMSLFEDGLARAIGAKRYSDGSGWNLYNECYKIGIGLTGYGWIIDKDHLSADLGSIDHEDARDDTGTQGPHDIPRNIAECLREDPDAGDRFRMYDDDGELYYEGRLLGAGVSEFEPLDDFGAPNAGCTEIRYLDRETKEWKPL